VVEGGSRCSSPSLSDGGCSLPSSIDDSDLGFPEGLELTVTYDHYRTEMEKKDSAIKVLRARKNQKISELEADKKNKRGRIGKLKDENRDKDRRISELEARVAALEKERQGDIVEEGTKKRVRMSGS
jgi:hypothetical protein